MIWRMDQRADVAEQFVGARAEDFPTSPLYRALRPVVAEQPEILDMLGHRRAGQQAPYLFFGAVHYLVLGGAEHPLRDFFASVVGDAARSPEEAGPALIDFCDTYRPELDQLIRTRLVQTNSVRRAVGLRYALAVIAQTCDQPVHLVEVGASAGTLLHVDRYRFRIGERSFGPADAAVTIDSDWRGGDPLPEMGAIPTIASRTGIDLHPVDATDPDERAWLRALVWPENFTDASLLDAALASLAADPPRLIAGDGIDVCPDLGRQLPRASRGWCSTPRHACMCHPTVAPRSTRPSTPSASTARCSTSGWSRGTSRTRGTRPMTVRSSASTDPAPVGLSHSSRSPGTASGSLRSTPNSGEGRSRGPVTGPGVGRCGPGSSRSGVATMGARGPWRSGFQALPEGVDGVVLQAEPAEVAGGGAVRRADVIEHAADVLIAPASRVFRVRSQGGRQQGVVGGDDLVVGAGEVQQQGDDHAGAVTSSPAGHQHRTRRHLGQGGEDGGDVVGVALQAAGVDLTNGSEPAEVLARFGGGVDQREPPVAGMLRQGVWADPHLVVRAQIEHPGEPMSGGSSQVVVRHVLGRIRSDDAPERHPLAVGECQAAQVGGVGETGEQSAGAGRGGCVHSSTVTRRNADRPARTCSRADGDRPDAR